VRCQDYQDIQWIVVDGGSIDGTVDELSSSKDVVTDMISEPDSGIYDAWNKACQLIKGEWVIFLGAGDAFSAHNVLKKFNAFIAGLDNHVKVVYGKVRMLDDKRAVRYIKKVSELNSYEFRRPVLPPFQGVFFKKDLFLKNQTFVDSYRIAGDSKFLLKVLLDYSSVYYDDDVSDMIGGGVSNDCNSLFLIRREIVKMCQELNVRIPIAYKIRGDLYFFLLYFVNCLLPKRWSRALSSVKDYFRSL